MPRIFRWRRDRGGESSRRTVHLVMCIGTVDEWAGRDDETWSSWIDELGRVARDEGLDAVTLYPLSGEPSIPSRLPVRQWSSHGVVVRAVCEPDGRHRLAEVVNAWPAGQALTEETLGRALTGPGGDPDVVAVVGAPGRLPGSLVWELAYAELVDVDREWRDFRAEDLRTVMVDFRARHRRFGGLGDENGAG